MFAKLLSVLLSCFKHRTILYCVILTLSTSVCVQRGEGWGMHEYVCVCACMHVCVNVVELLLCFVLEVGLYVYNRTLSLMQSIELKLITEKTEMMFVGSSVHISSVDCESADVGGSSIPFQTSVMYLGVHLELVINCYYLGDKSSADIFMCFDFRVTQNEKNVGMLLFT